MNIIDTASEILSYLPFIYKYKYISKTFLDAYSQMQKEYIGRFYKGLSKRSIINICSLTCDVDTILQYTNDKDIAYQILELLHICGKHRLIACLLKKGYLHDEWKWNNDIIAYTRCIHDIGRNASRSLESQIPYIDKRTTVQQLVGKTHPKQAQIILRNPHHETTYQIWSFLRSMVDITYSPEIGKIPYHYISKIRICSYKRLGDLYIEDEDSELDSRMKKLNPSVFIVSPSMLKLFMKHYDPAIYGQISFHPVLEFIYKYSH